MQTNNLLSFGAVIDTVATAAAPDYNTDSAYGDNGLHSGGIVIDIDTTKAWTQLQPANAGYIPVYDTETDSYKFFKEADVGEFNGAGGAIDAYDLWGSSGTSRVVFSFRLLFKDLEAYEILSRTTQSGLNVVLNIHWTGLHGMEVTYTMSESGIKTHAENQLTSSRGYLMEFRVYGLDGIGAGNVIAAHPTVVTKAGVFTEALETKDTYNDEQVNGPLDYLISNS